MDKKVVSDKITHYRYLDSPVGPLLLAGCKKGLRLINFTTGSQAKAPLPEWSKSDTCFTQVADEIDAYFKGSLKNFTFDFIMQGSPFQIQVWQALTKIPYGDTASYGDIAKGMGKPGASRAVGGANNANPFPIVVPCHRVIGANKDLVGFGGGMDTKKFLLNLEASNTSYDGELF